MSENEDFRQLLARARAGDQDAAAELFRRYEPYVRRAVRFRLRDARLRRRFDSADVCQSVLASFFARAALGQFDLNEPEALLRLLVAMARNKVAGAIEREAAQRRDYRRAEVAEGVAEQVSAPQASPASEAALAELVQRLEERFTPEERRLVELRTAGHEWAEIAEILGGTPEALRKRHGRALDRVARELGLDEVGDE